MEKPNSPGSNNFVVGMFVCVALLVVAGFVVFMGESTTFFGHEVRIKSVFRDVRGLNVGAPVFLSGVHVGRVAGMHFSASDGGTSGGSDIIVTFSIYDENRHLVKKDSEATITSQGVLGDKVVVISAGSPESPEVAAGDAIASRLPGELTDYLTKGGNLVETLGEVATKLNRALSTLNDDGRLARILENLETTSASMAKTTKSLSEGKGALGTMINGGSGDELTPALKNLHNILSKIDRGEGTLGALVNDASLHEDLRILLGGAKRSKMVRFFLRQAISSGEEKEEVSLPKK